MDALTGLHTRGEFERRLHELPASNETVTVAVLDIDFFKRVNDTHGHEVGDRVLAGISGHVRAAAAAGSAFGGRIGGDELALALPGTPLEAAFLRLEQLRAAVAADGAAIAPTVPEYQPSISVGLANWPRDVRSVAELMSRADQALWQAKEGGRNQVALPVPEEMVLKSNYYPPSQLGRLKRLAEQARKKESVLLREALEDLLRKYDLRTGDDLGAGLQR